MGCRQSSVSIDNHDRTTRLIGSNLAFPVKRSYSVRNTLFTAINLCTESGGDVVNLGLYVTANTGKSIDFLGSY